MPEEKTFSASGPLVSELRSHLGESQQQFGVKAGLSISSVQRYEKEGVPTSEYETLKRLGKIAHDAGRPDIRDALWEPIVNLANGVTINQPEPVDDLPAHERLWVEKLLYILRSKDQGAIEAVQENIVQFERLVTLARRSRR